MSGARKSITEFTFHKRRTSRADFAPLQTKEKPTRKMTLPVLTSSKSSQVSKTSISQHDPNEHARLKPKKANSIYNGENLKPKSFKDKLKRRMSFFKPIPLEDSIKKEDIDDLFTRND